MTRPGVFVFLASWGSPAALNGSLFLARHEAERLALRMAEKLISDTWVEPMQILDWHEAKMASEPGAISLHVIAEDSQGRRFSAVGSRRSTVPHIDSLVFDRKAGPRADAWARWLVSHLYGIVFPPVTPVFGRARK